MKNNQIYSAFIDAAATILQNYVPEKDVKNAAVSYLLYCVSNVPKFNLSRAMEYLKKYVAISKVDILRAIQNDEMLEKIF